MRKRITKVGHIVSRSANRLYDQKIKILFNEIKQTESEQYEILANGVIRENSTTRMTVKQFTEYLNAVNAYTLAKLGIMLTVPDELRITF